MVELHPYIIGLIGILGFLALAILGLPIAYSFASMGFIGIVLIQGLGPGLSSLGEAPYAETASYVLSTIPLFVLMGQFAYHSGISRDLFQAAYKWMGRLPGGAGVSDDVIVHGLCSLHRFKCRLGSHHGNHRFS